MSNKPSKMKKVANTTTHDLSRQIFAKPSWKGSDQFIVTGNDLQEITNLAQAFRPIVQLADVILQRGRLNDQVKNEYVYEDGSVVEATNPERMRLIKEENEAVEKMKAELKEYQEKLAAQQESIQKEMEKASTKETASSSK
jgi:hypothetical protein